VSLLLLVATATAASSTIASSSTIAESSLAAEIPLVATPTAAIYGRVLERGTRRPLEGVEIEIGDRIEVSGSGGRFRIEGIRAGLNTVRFVSPEHEIHEVTVELVPNEAKEVNASIVRLPFNPYEVTVRAKRRKKEPSVELDMQEIAVIPGSGSDALKAVQNLPGTMRTPLGLGGLIVRGSPAKDTKVFLEGHELPVLYHFGGLTSVVNADTLESLEFHPGNFSARYGRATGGVVEMETRGGKATPHGYLDIDLIDVTFVAEAALAGGGLLVSGRRSWVETFFNLAFSGLGNDLKVAPRTYDYQLRYEHPLWGGDLRTMLLGSDDQFEYVVGHKSSIDRPTLVLHTGFHRLQTSWRYKGEEGFGARVSASVGLSIDDTEVGDAYKNDLEQRRADVRAELSKRLDGFAIEGGVDAELVGYDLASIGPPPQGNESLIVSPNPLPEAANGRGFGDGGDTTENVAASTSRSYVAPGAWIEAVWDPWEALRIVPGLRADWHGIVERATVAPRLFTTLKLSDETAFGAGVGLYHAAPPLAFLHERFMSKDLDAEQALHASVSLSQGLPEGIDLSVELYLKLLTDLAVVTPRPRSALGESPGASYVSSGEGRSIGAEILLRRQLARGLFGWVAYTLSRSERTAIAGDPMQLFAYDQTHVLTFVLSYRTENAWTFGTRIRYASGNPYAPVEERVFLTDRGTYAPIFATTPTERLPGFFQIDVRIDKEWVFQEVIATAFLDIQNLTNKSNAEGYQYSFDYRERVALNGLPVLPTVGVRVQF
jgi:hypothetical protein